MVPKRLAVYSCIYTVYMHIVYRDRWSHTYIYIYIYAYKKCAHICIYAYIHTCVYKSAKTDLGRQQAPALRLAWEPPLAEAG